ncbi:MAG: hypothetical protein U1B83_03985, partial [Candidatus Cloacimonadaceae bacterium]|nr:hypothetical protein [Candidatus Cloacimonadaceae bacterium]
YKGGKQNKDLAKVSAEIISYARERDYAWWDLGSAMGGSGSNKNWRARDYASRDMVHFSARGYTLQGYLFYHALMRGYKTFTEGSGR